MQRNLHSFSRRTVSVLYHLYQMHISQDSIGSEFSAYILSNLILTYTGEIVLTCQRCQFKL